MSNASKESVPSCFDCKTRAVERLTEMFIQMTQERRIQLGQRPAERAVFRKLHGVAYGQFDVLPGIDESWRVGIFAQNHLPAWVRFSSDTSPPGKPCPHKFSLTTWRLRSTNPERRSSARSRLPATSRTFLETSR